MNSQILKFVLIAYAFTWTVLLIPISQMNGSYVLSEAFFIYIVIASFGPTVSALIVTYFSNGSPAVKTLLRKYLILKFPFVIYIVSVFTLPLVALVLYSLIGFEGLDEEKTGLLYLTIAITPFNGLITAFIGAGPLGEELGWRGFLQPLISKRNNDVKSSIIIGLIWAFWHLPMFLFPEWRDGMSFPMFCLMYPIGTTLLAFQMTKIWKWTKGSVFIAIWFHGIINSLLGLISNRKIFNYEGWDVVEVNALTLIVLLITALIYSARDKYKTKRITGINQH